MIIYINSTDFKKQYMKLQDNTYLQFQIVPTEDNQGELIILNTNNPVFSQIADEGNSILINLGNDYLYIKHYKLIFN